MMMFSWNSDDDHDFGDISSFFIVKLHPSLWFMTECLFSQYYQLCDSTLVQSRKECSCRWRKRWNIRLGWLSIGFLCFSRKYFSDSLNRISLIFLAVLGSDRAKYQIYMLSGLHWLFATNLSWKWLQVAELSWKGVNWVHLKNWRYFFFAKVRCYWVIWHWMLHVPLLDDRTALPVLECLAVLECSAVSGRLLASQLAGLCLFLPAECAAVCSLPACVSPFSSCYCTESALCGKNWDGFACFSLQVCLLG